ncbi:DUF3857 domain-containing protein [Tenacibaculum sp. M341]|uniref:DUF3857 domain-containing protein n=1 Tax=Tenacibaculum sp. M341 TaxID=2530339 RepID=UPI00104BAFC8|nr:DUF3857 domain-containing protein [Tenacibaculum sp. M341]TCI91504.1 DUF3857 domain-containing protein [Tenacibaculum sp. M341]
MNLKICILSFTLILLFRVNAQTRKGYELNKTTRDEIEMISYEKDSTTKAVVLEEKGHFSVDKENNYNFRRDIYKRIKFFDKSEIDRATITIDLYKNEYVKYIKAISYTNEEGNVKKIYLTKDKIYKKKNTDLWTEMSFTLPNVKDGSVIEYSYSVFSPYRHSIDDWYFQSSIPKIKSDFTALIPGNWKYNIRINGFQKLDREESNIKRLCLEIPGIKTGDCLDLKFGMDSVPAFKKEDYMLASKNYMSRLIFELESYTHIDGRVNDYVTTWEDADRTLKKYFLDNQTSKKNYFRKKLPQEIFSIEDKLVKVKAIFKHLQNTLTWNEKHRSTKLRVKESYESKTGSVDALNLILFNTLKAVDIDAHIIALSTRKNGMVTKLHPTTDDFNYFIVKTTVNGEDYLLDISNKNLLFGELPFKTLNGEGRLLDFKKGGEWQTVSPKYYSSTSKKVIFKFDEELNPFGSIQESYKGYFALNKRTKLSKIGDEKLWEEIEETYPDLEIDSLKFNTKDPKDFKINYNFNVPDSEIEKSSTKFKINPFVIDRITKNPFKLKERNYPVNFGYKWSKSYFIDIKTPQGYTLTKYPENTAVSLPNKGGRLLLNSKKTADGLTIYFKYSLNKEAYHSLEYEYLKEYFNKIIKAEEAFIHYTKQE